MSLALCLGPGFRGRRMLGQVVPQTHLVRILRVVPFPCPSPSASCAGTRPFAVSLGPPPGSCCFRISPLLSASILQKQSLGLGSGFGLAPGVQ